MTSTAKRICATTASFLAVMGLAFGLTGCGKSTPAPLDTADPTKSVADLREAAASRGNQSSKRARRFAPELLTAGDALVARAETSTDEARTRELIGQADQCYRDAETVADAVSGARTLSFPTDRSLGTISTSPWGVQNWRGSGDATGKVDIPAETMVYLSAGPDFTNDDMALLVALGPGAIQYLSLGDAAVSPDVLDHVATLTGLRDLSLAGMATLTDADLAPLASCLALRHLNLMTSDLTDNGIDHLAGLPALQDLAVQGEGITDKTAWLASRLPALETFLTRNTRITDVGIDHLANVPAMKRLWVFGPAVTRHSVASLMAMEDLEELVLIRTSLQHDQIKQLKEALPNCNVDVTS